MFHLRLLLASVCHAPPGDGGGGGALEALGSVRAINDGTSAADLNDVLMKHRAAIIEDAGDTAKRFEKLERMLPETATLVAKARSEAKAEWVPGGDAHQLDARYVVGDGIQFGRTVEKVLVPNLAGGGFRTIEQVRHGLLTDPHTVTPEHERARRAFGAYALARAIAGKREGAGALVDKSFLAFRSAMMALPGRTGEMVRAAFTDPNLFQRVISNTAGSGGELIATPTMSSIIRPADMARRLVGLVPVVEVPGSTFKQPIVTGRGLSRRRGATGDDPARYPSQRFTTSDQTLSVVDRVIQALLDDNWATEQALILGDPMGLVMDWLAASEADTLEIAFMHADLNAQDTLATWTLGGRYVAGQLDGTSSPLKFWNGIRAEAFDRSATVAGGGTFDAADHFGALALMGTLAAGARVSLGLRCFYEQFLANALFTTVDKAGAKATLQTGQLGQIGDTPIDLTDTLQKEFASTGLFTGSGTTNTAVYWNPQAYAHYVHTGGNDDWDVKYPDSGAQYVGMKRRSLLFKTCLSTEVPAAAIINL